PLDSRITSSASLTWASARRTPAAQRAARRTTDVRDCFIGISSLPRRAQSGETRDERQRAQGFPALGSPLWALSGLAGPLLVLRLGPLLDRRRGVLPLVLRPVHAGVVLALLGVAAEALRLHQVVLAGDVVRGLQLPVAHLAQVLGDAVLLAPPGAV